MIPAQKVAQKGGVMVIFYSSFFQYMLVIHQNGSHPQFIMPGIDVGINVSDYLLWDLSIHRKILLISKCIEY